MPNERVGQHLHKPLDRDGKDPEVTLARSLLAANVRNQRIAKSWSQELLAMEAGLHRTFVAHVERGSRNISIDNIERLALALDVPLYALFTRHLT
jgi:transcriptional regulator with XRE-family HTH domain